MTTPDGPATRARRATPPMASAPHDVLDAPDTPRSATVEHAHASQSPGDETPTDTFSPPKPISDQPADAQSDVPSDAPDASEPTLVPPAYRPERAVPQASTVNPSTPPVVPDTASQPETHAAATTRQETNAKHAPLSTLVGAAHESNVATSEPINVQSPMPDLREQSVTLAQADVVPPRPEADPLAAPAADTPRPPTPPALPETASQPETHAAATTRQEMNAKHASMSTLVGAAHESNAATSEPVNVLPPMPDLREQSVTLAQADVVPPRPEADPLAAPAADTPRPLDRLMASHQPTTRNVAPVPRHEVRIGQITIVVEAPATTSRVATRTAKTASRTTFLRGL